MIPEPLTAATIKSSTACETMRRAILDLGPGGCLEYFRGSTGHIFCGEAHAFAPESARPLFRLLATLRDSGRGLFMQKRLTTRAGLNQYAYFIRLSRDGGAS